MAARVSVLLLSYNHKPYVRDALESVLAQTYPDFEVIVLDNGSTDGSPELLREYEGHPKVRLVLNPENKSMTTRFNQGVTLSTADFVGFLYSDDLYLPKKLELQVAELDRLGPEYGVVTGGAMSFDDRTGEEWPLPPLKSTGWVLGELIREAGPSDMLSPLCRRECFLKYPFHEDIFAETESAYWKLAMTYKFGRVPDPVVRLRHHAGNRGRAIRANTEMGLTFLDRFERHPDLPPEHLPALRAYRRMLLTTSAWSVLRMDGEGAWARGWLREAVRLDWREAVRPRNALGYALSYVPARARALLNAAGNRLKGEHGNTNLVSGYGGGYR